jgi:hypothetical protein
MLTLAAAMLLFGASSSLFDVAINTEGRSSRRSDGNP